METLTPLQTKIFHINLSLEHVEILQRKRALLARKLGQRSMTQENFIRWAVLNAPVETEAIQTEKQTPSAV